MDHDNQSKTNSEGCESVSRRDITYEAPAQNDLSDKGSHFPHVSDNSRLASPAFTNNAAPIEILPQAQDFDYKIDRI